MSDNFIVIDVERQFHPPIFSPILQQGAFASPCPPPVFVHRFLFKFCSGRAPLNTNGIRIALGHGPCHLSPTLTNHESEDRAKRPRASSANVESWQFGSIAGA